MLANDDPPRRPLVPYRRSHRVDDEETVPDSEESTSPGQSRPLDDHSGNSTRSPINPAESDPSRPPRAVYRSRKRAISPLPLTYSSVAPVEEVIPDSEDNGKTADTSDDDNDGNMKKQSYSNAPTSVSLGLSDWKQKLRDIDDEYDADDPTQEIASAAPNRKGTSPKDPFDSPLTTEMSLQHTLHQSGANDSLSSPSRGVSSSTNTTPQFLFGTPQAPSPTPPTSDGKPSPMQSLKRKGKSKGKGKSRVPPDVQDAGTSNQLASSPDAIRQTRRSEKSKKPKAPTKKELLEARRETARMRSDIRASISTDATRPLDIKTLLKRFDVTQPVPSVRSLQPQSSVSEIEGWSSSSPASSHDIGRLGARHGETTQDGQHTSGRRSASPSHSTTPAPLSKYKVASAADDNDDDPFRIATTSSTAKRTGIDKDTGSGADSDVEMPGIGEILAEREARRLQRMQKERLQQIKLAALAQQQKGASLNVDGPQDNGHDSDDDDLDVVPDTMHSVAREEAAARAIAGRTKPSAGRTAQLRLARVPASPQRGAVLPLIPAPSDSPERRMAAAAQPAFLPSLSRGSGAASGRGKRSAGMTKAELERMMLRSAEAQSEQLRREKEDEWVRRGGRVVGVMEAVGEEKVQELISKALEHSEGTHAQGNGDGDDDAGSDDDDDDADYAPVGRGSASPQAQGGDDEEAQMTTEENMADDRDDDDAITEAAVAAMATKVDSETETENSAPHDPRPHHSRTARYRRAIIGSDDEDGPSTRDDDEQGVPLSLPDLPSPAFTSTASPWPPPNPEPSDHDPGHENDPYVSGNDTDKENRAVVRLEVPGPLPTHGARVLFDDILSARAGTKAGAQPLPLLQPSVLPADDDPFVFTPSPVKAREEALRRLASPTPRHLTGKRGLSQMFEEEEADNCPPVPALVTQGGDNDGATLDDADRGLVGFKPVLGGLSQAFEQTQERSRSESGIGGLAALRRVTDAEFSLTFEAQAAALQPALDVDDRLLAQAAAIFEKEQEYVIEAAQVAPSRAPRRELYITENGFLTQTRPDGSSPLVYRPSPSQRPYDALLRSQSDGALCEATGTQALASRPLALRQPLSTLAETSPTSSVRREPLRRLRRAHTSPDGPAPASERRYGYSRGPSLSPSPSPSPAKTKSVAVRTAFTELMMGGAAAQRDKENAKKRSEFVEDQAVESDEDDMLGFGGMRKKGGDDNEEEDDERDEEGVVKALVDDALMDEAALAKVKVLEKHQEHQTADDARLEKEVQDVVAGKRRTRRHGGAGGLLGSDEEEDEEDEEVRALRQRLAKKRRVAGDTLDALARNPATVSFHATYQMALVDNAEEFAHLDREQDVDVDVVPDRDREPSEDEGEGESEEGQGEVGGWDRGEGDGRERGVEEDEDEDEDVEMAGPSHSESGKREISAAEVRKALQEVARGEREYRPLDPEDVSWMDQDQIEADEAETRRIRVRVASSTYKPPPHRAHLLPADADMDVLSLNRIHPDEQQHDAAYAQRMKRWAIEEGASGASRSGGGRSTSRGIGAGAGAAVTGHRPRPRAAKSSASGAKRENAPGGTDAPPLRKTASALSAVADRRGRFGA